MDALLKTIRQWLTDPRVAELDSDSGQRIEIHRQVLKDKEMMKSVFRDFYQLCLEINDQHFSGSGKLIELGAGVSFFKELCPELIVSDAAAAPGLDLVLDAQQMDLPDCSVRALFGLNCFHHFSDPDAFFRELLRVLLPGGGCVLIEPYYGLLARPFYRALHKTEHFDPEQSSWTALEKMGVMTNANQALSYMVFERDQALFVERYPELEIAVKRTLSNYLRYLLSGGLNFRQLLPDWAIQPLKQVEALLRPLEPVTALHHVIALRRRCPADDV